MVLEQSTFLWEEHPANHSVLQDSGKDRTILVAASYPPILPLLQQHTSIQKQIYLELKMKIYRENQREKEELFIRYIGAAALFLLFAAVAFT